MKHRFYIKVFIITICILLFIFLGIALKFFVIGEPVDGAQAYCAVSESDRNLELRISSVESGVAFRGWKFKQDAGMLLLSARKVLVSPLFDQGDYEATIDLEGIDKVLFGGREIWPDMDNIGHNTIILPSLDEIIAVSLEHEGIVTNYDYKEWIGEFINILMDMDLTDESSIQDMPNISDYIKIDIVCYDDTIYTLFYYEKNGAFYVEQPYQGIYEPAPALGYYIESLLGGLTVDYPAMLMVDGQLYSGGGTVLTASLPMEADGQIISTCNGVPIKDGQSNFGSGYSYQYGADDTINVLLDDNEWHVFVLVDVERTFDINSFSEQERMELDPTY